MSLWHLGFALWLAQSAIAFDLYVSFVPEAVIKYMHSSNRTSYVTDHANRLQHRQSSCPPGSFFMAGSNAGCLPCPPGPYLGGSDDV